MSNGITLGETTFIAPEQTLWDMRQAAKVASREGLPKMRYMIAYEEYYYGDYVGRILADRCEAMQEAMRFGDAVVGETDGAWRCAALWSLESRTGVLLHRVENKLLYAYIPLVTEETAQREHAITVALSTFAHEVGDAPIMLEKAIPAGQHKLSDILEILSEEMEV